MYPFCRRTRDGTGEARRSTWGTPDESTNSTRSLREPNSRKDVESSSRREDRSETDEVKEKMNEKEPRWVHQPLAHHHFGMIYLSWPTYCASYRTYSRRARRHRAAHTGCITSTTTTVANSHQNRRDDATRTTKHSRFSFPPRSPTSSRTICFA